MVNGTKLESGLCLLNPGISPRLTPSSCHLCTTMESVLVWEQRWRRLLPGTAYSAPLPGPAWKSGIHATDDMFMPCASHPRIARHPSSHSLYPVPTQTIPVPKGVWRTETPQSWNLTGIRPSLPAATQPLVSAGRRLDGDALHQHDVATRAYVNS